MIFKHRGPTWFMILLAGLALLSGCQAFASSYEFKGSAFDPPLPLPDFELATVEGDSFHLSDLQGDYALVYFGYTFCPDVCPLTMSDLKKALTDLEGRERVQPIFISVDPERDTPEVLARYLNAFDADIVGLTDDFDKIQAVMRPFGAFAEQEEVSDSAAGYLVSHTARVYLISPNREILATYPFGFPAEDLRSDLVHLLQQDDG